MSNVYVVYNSNGKYVADIFDESPPNPSNFPGNFIRELTEDEKRMVGQSFNQFKYDTPELTKIIEVFFTIGGCGGIYELGTHNGISISVSPCPYIDQNYYQDLIDKNIEIEINGQKEYVIFGSQVFLNPSTSGIYTIKLTDDRVHSPQDAQIITVIEPQTNAV